MRKIFVTQPLLPPLDEYIKYLEKIWESKWITNSGQYHQLLEIKLADYLGVKYVSLFTNATIGLLAALKCLDLKGEVITTPYSFVATSHSLLWNQLTPVFVDIDPVTFNLDVNKIEKAITKSTTGIMPVHCYGNPCDVENIEKIARDYGLKVIYDAAHAFGVDYKGQSILNFGDLSVLSFHATKTFNTIEGGAIISHDLDTKQKIDRLRNFGFVDEVNVKGFGINGKMNELQAAFGILQLDYIDKAIESRKAVDHRYRVGLKNLKGISFYNGSVYATKNFSYFPIMVGDDYVISRDKLYELLKINGILARRYFYPLISSMEAYRDNASANENNLSIANNVANRILCLPIYPDMSYEDQDRIIKIIREAS